MARYKVTTDFTVEVGRDVVAGDVIDLDPKYARTYIEQGRLVLAPEEPKKPTKAKPEGDGDEGKADDKSKAGGSR